MDTIKLTPDLYSRNFIISQIISNYKKQLGKSKLKILDVGGREGKLGDFIKDEELTIVDIRPGNEDNIVIGDATNLKEIFEDNSFDIVTSGDVLEHISQEKRIQFLSEAERISKGLIIIAAPQNTNSVIEAEEEVLNYFIAINDIPHPWLQEHKENGLPVFSEVKAFFEGKGYFTHSIGSNNINTWTLFEKADALSYEREEIKPFIEEIFRFYNGNLLSIENPDEDFYRKVFIAHKKDFRPTFQYQYSPKILLDFTELIAENLTEIIQIHSELFQSKFKLKKYKTQIKDWEISKLSDVNIQLENRISHLNQIINEKEARISELKQLDHTKESRISELKQLDSSKESRMEELTTLNNILTNESTSLKEKFKTKQQEIEKFNEKLSSIEQNYLVLQNTLNEIFKSKTWKLFTLYKKFADPIYIMRHNFVKFVSNLKKNGLIYTLKKTKNFLLKKNICSDVSISYSDWIKEYELPKDYYKKAKTNIKNFSQKPLISIILPTYCSNVKWLKEAIDSVQNQYYKNWELIIVDDASPEEDVRTFLQDHYNDEKRVKTVFLKKNLHISGSSNKGLERVKGEFVVLMDHDDTLAPNALYEVIKAINENPDVDMIYSDRDMLNIEGKRWGAFFKPDFSPELIESCMYMEHLNAFRTTILRKINGWRKGTEGAQDWDLVLRFIEETTNICHIPHILYHWRDNPNSVGSNKKTKDIQKSVLENYVQRNKIKATVHSGIWNGSYRIKREILDNPKVSIIIPMKDKPEVTKKCIKSILKKTDYKNYEIIIVDNNSEEERTQTFFKWAEKKECKIIRYSKPFNFSAINNYAARKATGELLLFLNNDTEIINEEWMKSMIEHAQRKEIGCVGAKLIYPNNTVQHAGVIVGLGGAAAHSHKQFSKDNNGYGGFINIVRNYSAVTAACLMIRKEVFDEIEGFEESFKVAYNDVDLCLKTIDHGYRNVYTPYAQLYHYESLTRKHAPELQNEIDRLNQRWPDYFEKGDPFYNPNLTLAKEDFDLRLN